jgi:hypothetical protein
MRASGLRGTPRGPNGHKDLGPRDAARAVEETTSPELVDEQIESLLLSFDEQAEPEKADELYSAPRAGRAPWKRRSARRRHHRHSRVSQFDLFFVVTAVVLGFAVGLLTVFLVNG